MTAGIVAALVAVLAYGGPAGFSGDAHDRKVETAARGLAVTAIASVLTALVSFRIPRTTANPAAAFAAKNTTALYMAGLAAAGLCYFTLGHR